MKLFHNKNKRKKSLNNLLKDRAKKDKEIEKDFQKRCDNKYTTQNLKLAKNLMIENAMTIDKQEYEEIAKKLKETTK